MRAGSAEMRCTVAALTERWIIPIRLQAEVLAWGIRVSVDPSVALTMHIDDGRVKTTRSEPLSRHAEKHWEDDQGQSGTGSCINSDHLNFPDPFFPASAPCRGYPTIQYTQVDCTYMYIRYNSFLQ